MKTVKSAHLGWSKLNTKAIRSASRPEAAVLDAKIAGIHLSGTIGRAGRSADEARNGEAARLNRDPAPGGRSRMSVYARMCAYLLFPVTHLAMHAAH